MRIHEVQEFSLHTHFHACHSAATAAHTEATVACVGQALRSHCCAGKQYDFSGRGFLLITYTGIVLCSPRASGARLHLTRH